jgi:hypothetical protein
MGAFLPVSGLAWTNVGAHQAVSGLRRNANAGTLFGGSRCPVKVWRADADNLA